MLRDIEGFIRTVVQNPIVDPTHTPKNFNQQFEIRIDLTSFPVDKRLYIYSFETKLWSYIILS